MSGRPIEECLRAIERLGFDGAEICLENDDLRPELLNTERVAAVRQLAEELGFATWSVSYHQDYIYDDELLEKTLQGIAWTPVFGARIFVFSGTPKRTGDEAEWRRMVDRTRRMVAVAEEHDVILAKEFEPEFIAGCTLDMLRLFDEIPSPNLAANLDLGHAFLCDPDPFDAIRALGDKIVHGHIEDMAAGVHRHLPPGQGDMDLAAYLRVLAEVGYDGGLALDLYTADYEAVAAQAVPYLRSLMPSA